MPKILHFQVDDKSVVPQITPTFKKASRNGHLECLKWFLHMIYHQLDHSNLIRMVKVMVVSAIKGDCMQVLLWISETLGWIPQAQVVWDRERNFGSESMFVAKAAKIEVWRWLSS